MIFYFHFYIYIYNIGIAIHAGKVNNSMFCLLFGTPIVFFLQSSYSAAWNWLLSIAADSTAAKCCSWPRLIIGNYATVLNCHVCSGKGSSSHLGLLPITDPLTRIDSNDHSLQRLISSASRWTSIYLFGKICNLMKIYLQIFPWLVKLDSSLSVMRPAALSLRSANHYKGWWSFMFLDVLIRQQARPPPSGLCLHADFAPVVGHA